jgi:hypothetical protein
MARELLAQFDNVRRRLLLCALAGAILPSLGGAQTVPTTLNGTIMKSALHSFPAGHDAFVTVSEGGFPTPTSVTRITIEIRDGADQLVSTAAIRSGILKRGDSVRLRVPLGGSPGDLIQVRAVVRVVSTIGSATVPQAVFEDINADSLAIKIKGQCSNPEGQEFTPSCGGCDGWAVLPFKVN